MTPKEKAKELVDKFNVVGLQQRAEAYQCAVIAVDEIIASNPIAFDENDNCIEKNWWQEVKIEIKKL
jgi:hypothetical protein